jgi:hypothetical protein
MRVTVSAMPSICRNWQNAYFISLSKGLNALEGQTTLVASEENRALIEDSVTLISRKLVAFELIDNFLASMRKCPAVVRKRSPVVLM